MRLRQFANCLKSVQEEMTMIHDRYIEIPADKLRDAISLAYALSSPVGMGMIHYREGGLDSATIDAVIATWAQGPIAARMDYVHGRQCKFTVRRDAERLFVGPSWHDHSEDQLIDLLTALGVESPREKIKQALASA